MNGPSAERWRYTETYLSEVFGVEDEAATAIRAAAESAGLPPIAISSDVGRFLTLVTRLVGTRRALEIGTLAGYSALHIARGLETGGSLITLEADSKHAALARRNLEAAGVADRVRVEAGSALDTLPVIAEELGAASVDLVFMDAQKTEYMRYWRLVRPMLRAGGLLIADNVLGTGRWWIDDVEDPERIAVDEFNRALAADPGLEVAGLLVRQGILMASVLG